MKTVPKLTALFAVFLICLSSFSVSAEAGFRLPADLTVIEDEAFLGVPLNQLNLPEGLSSIGSKAFAYTGLKRVYIPSSVQHIEPDAFEGCDHLEPFVNAGSYAESWCEENNVAAWKYISLGVAAHTQAEIRAFINAHPAETSSTTTYRRSPTTNPYVPGLISENCIQNAINMLNQFRYIAGLNADVINAPDEEEKMAAAAMINGLNGNLSHTPNRPSVWADSSYDSLYELAFQGAGSANLSAGRRNLAASVAGYMDDSSSSNIDRVGHRRWILNPSMGKTALGYYYSGNSTYGAFSSMFAFDLSGSGRQRPVAWPAQNTPISISGSSASTYFSPAHAWSVSFGYYLTESAVSVSVVRNSDGKTWNFSSDRSDGDFYVNNDGFGLPGCVIFRPANIGTISPGNSFSVTITDEERMTILKYSVSFF